MVRVNAGRVRNPRPGEEWRVGGQNPDVEAGAVEQIAERQHEPTRQEQHVEQKRTDRGDAQDCQRRARRLPDDREP